MWSRSLDNDIWHCFGIAFYASYLSTVSSLGVYGEQRQPFLPPAHHDEGSVRQLRGPEDD